MNGASTSSDGTRSGASPSRASKGRTVAEERDIVQKPAASQVDPRRSCRCSPTIAAPEPLARLGTREPHPFPAESV